MPVADDTEKIIEDPNPVDTDTDDDDDSSAPIDKDTKPVDGKDTDDLSVPSKEEKTDAQDVVDSILEKHGFESLNDIDKALEKSQSLQELIGSRDANKLVQRAETLERYEEYWAEQDRQRQMEEEAPEETIARLDKELRTKEKEIKKREQAEAQTKALEKTVKNFEKAVRGEISKEKEVPKEFKKFLDVFTGVDHPANQISLDDIPAVKGMAKSQIKLFKDLEQSIIRRYLDGKADIPPVPPTDTTAAPVDKGAKVKNLAQAKQILHERVSNIFKNK